MPVGGVRGRGECDCGQISTNSELMMLCIQSERCVWEGCVCVWEGCVCVGWVGVDGGCGGV